MRDLGRLIKAYDIRGTVPDQVDESLAYDVGAAFARLTGADRIVTGRVQRPEALPRRSRPGRAGHRAG
jgi:phosphomannomutase